MTEATFTRALLAHMRLMAPDAVIDKVNDRVAGGRPDVNITVDGRTHFLEIKHGPLTAGLQTLLRKVTPKQCEELRRRAKASHGRAWVLLRTPAGWQLWRWTPEQILGPGKTPEGIVLEDSGRGNVPRDLATRLLEYFRSDDLGVQG